MRRSLCIVLGLVLCTLTACPHQRTREAEGPGHWTCEILLGSLGAEAPTLRNDADARHVCGNFTGRPRWVTTVSCIADAGNTAVLPITTGGTANSLITGSINCSKDGWTGSVIAGKPVIYSFNEDGMTCPVTPCTLDANISTAGKATRYVVLAISGTY